MLFAYIYKRPTQYYCAVEVTLFFGHFQYFLIPQWTTRCIIVTEFLFISGIKVLISIKYKVEKLRIFYPIEENHPNLSRPRDFFL